MSIAKPRPGGTSSCTQPRVQQTQLLLAARGQASKFLLLSLLVGYAATAGFALPNPVESLKRFSAFRSVDSARLVDGEILGERGSLMDFPQGITAQTCFVLPVTAAEAAQRLQTWDPSPHEALNVLAFSPIGLPCQGADFASLDLRSSNHALRWLLDKSFAATTGKSELNLTRDEARQLADCAKGNPAPQAVSACWAKLLLQRVALFQRQGFAAVPPYETSGKTISPADQLQAMLREKTAMTHEFAPLLMQSGVLGREPAPTLTPFYYWGLCEANRHGTLYLGAAYLLPLDDRYQILKAQYYVSGTYYTSVTLFQVWPIQVGEKSGALVWRGDFYAAPSLALTRGIDRLATGAIMLQELKKAIRCFQADVIAKRLTRN